MRNLSFAALLGLLLISCSDSTVDETEEDVINSVLPKSPEEVEIIWSDGGGMMDLSTGIYISADSSSWNYRRSGNEKSIAFVTSEEELDELYQVILDNQFDKIRTRSEGEVYDRGGIDIRLTVDGNYYDINNSGSYFIVEKWVKNWSAVSDAITSFTAEKLEELRFEYTIKLDKSITDGDYPINLGVDGSKIYSSANDGPLTQDQIQNGFTSKILQGPTEIDLYLFYPDSTNSYGGQIVYSYEVFSFDFTTEQNETTFYLEGDQLMMK
ncbi:hypothetical protein JYT72_03290 [Crocinitomix catalasitica]|nr:hypothetical protein [Crocinitomix catalasitica]